MKILVATKKGQGLRSNDFCFVPEGEPVTFVFECDDEGPDGSCGCQRSMGGTKSHCGTTTFMVADAKITKDKYFELIRKNLEEGGWLKGGFITNKAIMERTEELLRVAKAFRPGVILEKRGPEIQVRTIKEKHDARAKKKRAR